MPVNHNPTSNGKGGIWQRLTETYPPSRSGLNQLEADISDAGSGAALARSMGFNSPDARKRVSQFLASMRSNHAHRRTRKPLPTPANNDLSL